MRRIRRKREMDDYFSSEDEFAFSFRKVTAIAFEERREVEIFHRIFVSWLALGSPIWRRFFFYFFQQGTHKHCFFWYGFVAENEKSISITTTEKRTEKSLVRKSGSDR